MSGSPDDLEKMSIPATPPQSLRKVLIASANPLFARGLQKMVAEHWGRRGAEIRLADSMEQAIEALNTWKPDLVIVDYDDVGRPGAIQRETFLSHFIAGERPMQVMLVSLRASGEVVVYDRRTLTPDQAEDWFDLPWTVQSEISEQTQPPRRNRMRHFVIVGLLTAVLTALVYFLLTTARLYPVAASVQAGPIDAMINLQVGLISFLFALIVSFISYSVIFFRQKPGEKGDGPFVTGSTRLEVLWTLFPLVLVIYLSFAGAQALAEVRQPEAQVLQVKVTAFQWSWLFEYPEYGIQSNTLYMPVDRQAHITLTSRDVIHSFWVPEFRVKQDALPGANLVKEVRITPTIIGDYKVRCAEMCGGAHAYMESPVKVVSQADFDAWVQAEMNAANASPEQRGERWATTNCTSCHALDGSRLVGPSWKGVYGSQITLADGSTVTVDDAYLLESILDPNAKIHQGFPPNVMPANYDATLTEQQINDIIAFIKTIK